MTRPHDGRDSTSPASTFRRTLIRVMAVQVVTLVLLWLLQSHYGS